MSTRLILIRHGETAWNRAKKYCGFSDVPLNKKGRLQAIKLSKRLRSEKVHKVYSSDMERAFQFARIVFKDMPIERLMAFREMNFGKFEGLTYQEIMERHPKLYQKWLNDPLNIKIPGGETLNNMAKRIRRALKEILSTNKDKQIAVFSHAGTISVILCDVLKLGLKGIWQVKQDSGNFNIIEFNKGKGKVHLMNDTSYLTNG